MHAVAVHGTVKCQSNLNLTQLVIEHSQPAPREREAQ